MHDSQATDDVQSTKGPVSDSITALLRKKQSRLFILCDADANMIFLKNGADTMMTFIARMKIKEGKEDDFVELARRLTKEVHAKEPDTLRYEFFKLDDEPRGYAVLEQFTDEAAEEAHRDTPHFHELAPPLIECLDGTYVREFLTPLD